LDRSDNIQASTDDRRKSDFAACTRPASVSHMEVRDGFKGEREMGNGADRSGYVSDGLILLLLFEKRYTTQLCNTRPAESSASLINALRTDVHVPGATVRCVRVHAGGGATK
jgi:hypothetical protein